MKVKRFFANIIVLLIAAGAVFFIGWVQFRVSPGTCGIMTSKTGGLYEEPLVPGKFDWKWEKLLPTNVTIKHFNTTPYETTASITGSLPSSSDYASILQLTDNSSNPDFSYKLAIKTALTINPEDILELVKNNGVQDQASLDKYMQKCSDQIVSILLPKVLKENNNFVEGKVLSSYEIEKLLQGNLNDFKHISINSIELTDVQVPDVKLYQVAENALSIWQNELETNLKQKAKEQANSVMEEDRMMQQLEKFASLLEKYPQLSEFSKTGNLKDLLKGFGFSQTGDEE